jgi:hypothetical protein
MESAIMNVNHASQNSRFTGIRRGAALLLTALGLLACAPTSPSGREVAANPSRVESNERVVPVRGFLVGGGSLEGHVDLFTASVPVEHCRAELYVKSFPTEEFDAHLVRVNSLGDGRYEADLELSQPDPRIGRQTRFEGFTFKSDSAGPLACADSDH